VWTDDFFLRNVGVLRATTATPDRETCNTNLEIRDSFAKQAGVPGGTPASLLVTTS
jgi:hypothetical protein